MIPAPAQTLAGVKQVVDSFSVVQVSIEFVNVFAKFILKSAEKVVVLVISTPKIPPESPAVIDSEALKSVVYAEVDAVVLVPHSCVVVDIEVDAPSTCFQFSEN